MSLVLRRDEEGVCILSLNRPERRNALSNELIEALFEALTAASADPSVRVIVLTGEGKTFCAGGDLAGGMAGEGGVLDGQAKRARYADLLSLLPKLRPPVIAAVQGDAMGGGFGLVAASDLVIVDEEASLGTPEIKVGLFPMIILAALQREIPRKALMELVLTGGKLSAARAVELGVANRVAPRGTALNEAITMARTIAALSPAIVGLGKSVFHRAEGLPYDQALQWLVSQLTLTLMTEDAGEGIAAFVERRPPVWRGR